MNPRRDAILTQPALLPITGNFDRKPRSLDRDVTTIGRARGSDLCLEANEISTLHCIIYRSVEGFRIRDCNSRTGTRINGESSKNQLLHDGDIINLGPFSFELRIPPSLFPKEGERLDPIRIQHWKASRRKLAERALKLRERLRYAQPGSASREHELIQKAQQIKEKIRAYDHRSGELEAAEQELNEEREKLAQEQEAQRARVQQIERELAERLAQTEQDVHQHWQEFQQRCQAEEARLRALAQEATASAPPPPANADAAQHQPFHQERQEFLTMKEQWVKDQSQTAAALEEQKAALQQQEAAVRAQKGELVRMMGELKKMQENLRKTAKSDASALQLEIERLQQENADLQEQLRREDNAIEVVAILAENEKLRSLVAELETQERRGTAGMDEQTQPQMADLRAEIELLREELQHKQDDLDQLRGAPAAVAGDLGLEEELQAQQAENERLQKLVQEKDRLIAAARASVPTHAKTENDLERYETELNDYRRQLDVDRQKLNKEVEVLRERNKELNEAVREMEMEMSKERAELGRERMRLERVRDEIKGDMERLQREIAVRDSMAPVQKLREEMTNKQSANGKPDKVLNDRLKSFRNQLTDSPS